MKQFILCIFLLVSIILQAQIQHSGRPAGINSISYKASLRSATKPTTIVMPEIDSTKITTKNTLQKALQFAQSFNVDLSPDNCGTWYINQDSSKIWQVTIQSNGASSINIIFDKYKLPQGAKLFIYNSDMTHVIGAFTNENNKTSGCLPTLPICGDEIIVEYQEPANPEFDAELHIGQVNHDYTNIFNKLKTGYFGDSESCENDVTCFTDDIYTKNRRSTVKLIINGSELMSGTLINNTQKDGTPYIITAAHGYEDHNYSADNTLFVFNYQVPLCFANLEGTREQSIAGGTLVAYTPKVSDQALDFALIEMSVTPPTAYQPYYVGWNRSSTSPSSSFCIHHPQGDVKKISFDDDALLKSTLSANGISYYPNAHWHVQVWDDGVTEGGSSGSGLFNPQGQFIGALSGGAATCSYPKNDYFYRFDLAWDTYSDTSQQLAHWLDPDNTGVQELEAYEPTDVTKTERITHINTNSDVTTFQNSTIGNIAGNNNIGITRFVEKFESSNNNQILGVYFVAAEGKPGSVVNTTVWTGNEMPEEEVYNESLLIKQWAYTSSSPTSGTIGGFYPKDSLDMQENFIYFSSPITVTGNYFIGFEVDNSQQTYPFGLVLSYTNSDDNAFYYDTEWHSYQELSDYNKATTLWIDAVALTDSSASMDTAKNTNLKVYPNPVESGELLTVEASNLTTSGIKIYDIIGRAYNVKVESLSNNKIKLNIDYLSPGIFILKTKKSQILFEKR